MTELLGPDGEPLVDAERINERGQVVGVMGDDDPAALATVVWERGRTTRVTPEGVSALPTGISDRGQVVGTVLEGPLTWPMDFTVWPFSWSGGELTRLTPEDVEGAASDVDERGRVLGSRRVGYQEEAVAWDDGETVVGPVSAPLIPWDRDRPHLNSRGQATLRIPAGSGLHAAVWQVGVRVTDLGTFGGPSSWATAINDRGWVVGNADTAEEDGPHAFLWRRGRMLDLGSGSSGASFAVDVNDRGQVLVNGNAAGGGAYLWENGRETDLGDLGGDYIGAVALNERGQVIGQSETAEGEIHAFLWERGRMTDLGALAGDVRSEATDLNERGQVIGQLTPASGPTVPVLWTVPPGR